MPKKVAILSGSTVGEIKNILELFLLNAGIRPEFYVGGYALFYEELTFDADGALAAFAPDVIYVHTSARNLGNLPLQTDTPEPVSYTHLDVYKRQWHACAGSLSAGAAPRPWRAPQASWAGAGAAAVGSAYFFSFFRSH